MGVQKYEIRVVNSNVFGGNVKCAGLLLVEDYIKVIAEFLKKYRSKRPEYIFLPRNSFDKNMEDLSMESVVRIRDIYNIGLMVC